MFKILSIGLLSLFFSLSAAAQEFGITGGFHHSSAKSKVVGLSENGEVGYRLGMSAKFSMVDNLNFKTGLIYSMRSFEISTPAPTTTFSHDFSYLDIPALIEFKFNETFGLFGGLVMAVNMNDKVSPGGSPTGTTSIMPLVHGGVSLLFDDMYGFDIYVERGLGDAYDGAKDITSFGASFVFWL